VIVSDDGSIDGTVELLAQAAATGRGYEIVRNERRLGAIGNFNATLGRARADLVFLCDQDDVWHDDKVEKMARAAADYPEALLLYSDARIVDATGQATGRTLFQELRPSGKEQAWLAGGQPISALLRRNFVSGATVALRPALLSHALPIPEGYWHDEWLALVAAVLGRLHRLEATLVDYRIHAGNQAGVRGVAPAARWRAMTSGRGSYHTTRLRKLDLLLERLEAFSGEVPQEHLALVRDCRKHWAERASLPNSRAGRLPTVVRELTNGRYRRFSTGWRSAIRDLFESLP
jgi:glycosyltransferase involved in cell wall biosynthesis